MRILLVDDHQFLCVALSEHLKRIGADISDDPVEVVSVFTLDEAIEVLADDGSDLNLIFLDLNLDECHQGAATLERFQQSNSKDVPVVVFTGLSLTQDGATTTLRRCFKDLGARGIVLKGTELDAMMTGMKRILGGEVWMPQEVMMAFASDSPVRDSASHKYLGLSKREWEVANLLTQGLQDKAIARELDITHNYVRQVTGQIYRKLDVRGRTEAAIFVKDAIDRQDRPNAQ
jgi:DNA-binding NarL/FixJ family response regulator